MVKTVSVPPVLKKMNAFFERAGFEAYLVGGAVRDMLRGKSASDWDVATNARPEQVQALFRRVIPTGIEHGTLTVIFMSHHIEVTTFRSEHGYSDGRRPDEVSYEASIEQDLSRRDFTMNALALNLSSGALCDPFGGKKDIKAKIIRTVGKARDRFVEDGLRPVRAIRFASTLHFTIESDTLAAIPLSLDNIKCVSIERFRDEFIKIITGEKPSYGLKLLEQTGVLNLFIPELCACRHVTQDDGRGFHRFDVLDHLFYACDYAQCRSCIENGKTTDEPGGKSSADKDDGEQKNGGKNSTGTSDSFADRILVIRLAALFHDIGKPRVRAEQVHDGVKRITFYSHEKESARICTAVLERLRFPAKTVRYVSHLVSQHMFHYESSWTDAAVRRFMARVTPPAGLGTLEQTVNDLFDVRIADVSGMTNSAALLHTGQWSANLLEFRERIQKELNSHNAIGLKDLAVSGSDLIRAGIPAGKTLGLLLQELLQTVLDDPACNTKEKLMEIAKRKMG